jgi:hypothetical protein
LGGVLLACLAVPTSALASSSFGIERYGLTATEENGSADTQAGSHPYELTLEAGLDFKAQSSSEVRGLGFELPPGLIIDSSAVPFCTGAQFAGDDCPNSAAVGAVRMSVAQTMVPAALYNVVPVPGEPAELGFTLKDTPVIADVAVRTGGDYGMTVSIHNIPQDEVESVKLMLWGVPSDSGHDALRGRCLTGEETVCPSASSPSALLTLPSSCAGSLQTMLQGESWGGETVSVSALFQQMTGCELLPFSPSIEVVPDGLEADTPTGFAVQLRVPQESSRNPVGLAESDARDVAITLPSGMQLNPSIEADTQGCSTGEIGFTGFSEFQGARTATFTPGLRATVVLAAGSFSVAEGKSRTVVLHPTAAGKKLLSHANKHHPVAAKLTMSVKGGKTMAKSVLAV